MHHLIAPRGLTLLVAAAYADRWAEAARAAGAGVRVRAVGPGAEWTDPDGAWADVRGVGDGGALLVRPDRHIAWRASGWSKDSAAELRESVHSVLTLRPSTVGIPAE